MTKIHFITVNYKQDNFVRSLIQDLTPFDDCFLTIIDNSRTMVEIRSDRYQIIGSDNIGYLPGLKKGLNYSELKINQKVVLLNPDIKITTHFIETLKTITLKRYDMLAPSVIDLETGVDQNPNLIRPYSLARKILIYFEFSCYPAYRLFDTLKSSLKPIKNMKRKTTKKVAQKIHWAHGSIMVFDVGLFLDFDFDTPDVFLWGEEVIIANWVHDKGGEIYYMPDLEVIHQSKSATSRVVGKSRFNIWRDSYRVYREFL